MSIFFYPDARRSEKISISVTLILTVAFWVALLLDFAPTQGFWSFSSYLAFALAPALVAAIWIFPPFHVPKRIALRKVLFCLVMLPIAWCSLVVLISKGAGLVSLIAAGDQTVEPYRIVLKLSATGRQCHRKLVMQSLKNQRRIEGCVGKDMWGATKTGDLVTASVVSSKLGYSVRSISR